MKKIIISGFFAGLAMLFIGLLLGRLFNILVPSIAAEYNSPLFRPWSDPLMLLYFVHPFLNGWLLAWVWRKTKDIIRFENYYIKAIYFAFFFWLVTTVPGMFISFSSFQISWLMIMTWTISGLLQTIAAAIIFAKIYKTEPEKNNISSI